MTRDNTKKAIHSILTLLLLGLLPLHARSEEPPGDSARSQEIKIEEKEPNDSGFIPLPMVAYTPDTGVMGIMSGIYFWNKDKGEHKKPNTISFFALYTQENQYTMGINSSLYTLGEHLKVAGTVLFSRFPNRFYGIGPDTSWNRYETYTPVTWNVKSGVLVKLAENLYIGPAYQFTSHSVIHREPGGMLAEGSVRGSRGTRVSGAGIETDYDTRNSVFYPTGGIWFHARALGFGRFLGSREEYWSLELDLRSFLSIYRGHVVATQLYFAVSGGEVPFQEMKAVGGGMRLRGYYMNRFIDRSAGFMQAEYRFPIIWRFGGALFFGVGQVAPSLERYRFDNLKFAGGAGLRFTISSAQMINFRLDAGFSKMPPEEDRFAVYFLLREAF